MKWPCYAEFGRIWPPSILVSVLEQLEQVAVERGSASALDLIKASMKEERRQYDTP